MNKGYLISRFKCSQRRFNVCKVGSSLLTSTIQGHKKTTIEQDKLKIPLPAILLESATAIFVKWDSYLITKLQQYYKIRQVLLRCVRGTRTQPLICVGCSVHYWVSWAINKRGFFRDCIRRRRRRRHTFASLWDKLIFSLFLLILILVSSIHTLPVNIFILEGGETMLAQEKGNFYAPGENRTRDSLLAFYLRVKA